MANYELNDDWVVSIPIVTQNSAGVAEPAPSGDVYTAVSSNPASLNVVVGFMADGTTPAVLMNALVQASPGITVTLTDSAGLTQWVQIVDIVADVTPTNLMMDVANATHTTQAVPAGAGP
jgi:hypothetical protein